MTWHRKKKKQLVWLLLTALFFTQMPANEAKAQTTLPSGTPYPAVSSAPSQILTTTVEPNVPLYTPAGISPTPSADVLPSTTPTVTPAATSFTLLNKNVSKHVSKKKVQYQIHSYVTDTVALKTSLKATFEPIGETVSLCRRGILKIEKNGQVKCLKKGQSKAQNCQIKVTEAEESEPYRKKPILTRNWKIKGKSAELVYQGKQAQIRTNYKMSRLTLTSSTKKKQRPLIKGKDYGAQKKERRP